MKSKTITILFITSIVFNLLLVGFLAGNYTNSEGRFRGRPHQEPPWLKWVPEQQRERIKQGLKGDRNEMGGLKSEMEKHHQLVIETVTEISFDPSKLKQLLQEQRQRVLQLQEKGDDRLVKKISGLSLEERLKISERMRLRKSHRPPINPPPRHHNNPQRPR